MLVEQEVGRSAGGVVEEGDYSVWGDPAWHRVGLDLRTGWVERGQTSYPVAIPSRSWGAPQRPCLCGTRE